ncbi:MAG: cobalamin B12-binding domain-containing protein [Paracoccaceae bacterium]
MSPSRSQLLKADESQHSSGRFGDLASKALSEVATRGRGQDIYLASNAPFVGRLLNAAMSRSGETLRDAAQSLLAQGIPAEVIIDDIVPRVARMMGEEWVRDISGFASVTVGSMYLQSLVRELSASWTADDADLKLSTVLLWMPESAQHTLGATVVSTQLRRMGHSVQFAPRRSLTELTDALTLDRYDAVVVSASFSETPDDVRAVIKTVKAHAPTLPVAVGGTILKHNADLAAQTGADVATNDLEVASQLFSVAK